jgi:hypothetical protein
VLAEKRFRAPRDRLGVVDARPGHLLHNIGRMAGLHEAFPPLSELRPALTVAARPGILAAG